VSDYLHSPGSFIPREMAPWYILNRLLDVPQSCSEHFGEAENLFLLPGIEPQIITVEAFSLVTILCQLLWLLECTKFEIYFFVLVRYGKANCDNFSITDITLS
jgi:hypothetical protein